MFMNTSVVLKSTGCCWVARRSAQQEWSGRQGQPWSQTAKSSRRAPAFAHPSVSSLERGCGSLLAPDSHSPCERTPRAASASCSARQITRSCFSRPSLHRMAPKSGCGVARGRERKGRERKVGWGTSRGHLGEHSQATARQQRCCCASSSSSKYASSSMHKRQWGAC